MCIAQAHQLGVDHNVTNRDVRQEAPLTISERSVQLKLDALALDQMPVGLGGRRAKGLDGEIGDMFMTAVESHLDRRAVDHPEHLHAERVLGAEGHGRRWRWRRNPHGPPDDEHQRTHPHTVGAGGTGAGVSDAATRGLLLRQY